MKWKFKATGRTWTSSKWTTGNNLSALRGDVS